MHRSTSSSASILSGRSLTFGSRKITMRVQIAVEYDGPNLSDTSSLVSMEEYRQRMHPGGGNGSSWDDFDLEEGEVDDDSVTVSSRDAYAPSLSLSSDIRAESTHSSSLSPESGLGSGSKFSSTTPSSSLTPSSLSSTSHDHPPPPPPKDIDESDPFASRPPSTYSLPHHQHPNAPSQYSLSPSHHAHRPSIDSNPNQHRSEERRVGKECRN